MAFSTVGWVAAAFRLTYSWASLALSSALAWPTPSSNAALVALKFRADRRSKAANCERARPKMASTPALLVLAICSGVRYMVISVKKCARLECLPVINDFCGVPVIALQQIGFYKGNNRCESDFVRRN